MPVKIHHQHAAAGEVLRCVCCQHTSQQTQVTGRQPLRVMVALEQQTYMLGKQSMSCMFASC